MDAATVNSTAPAPAAAQNGQPSHSPTVSAPEQEIEIDDGDSILSDPPAHDEPMPLHMQMDGAADHQEATAHPDQHATDEPNPKKRKRYNDPPQEVHAELRRPQLAGQWYSKSPEQWEELSHLHKLIYSHVGRIEETDLGEEVQPCEACLKRGFKCMKYKQDHPEVEKLYKGNVRVGTSCTRCRRYRRTCALPGKKTNGSATTPNRPQSMSNGYPVPPGTTGSDYKTHGADGLDTWENTLLAAASGGSPLTSVASTPEYEQPPPHHEPPAPIAHQHPQHLPPQPQHYERPPPAQYQRPPISAHDLEDVSMAVNKVAFLDKVQAVESELKELRATVADFNKERRHWHDQKRDLQAEVFHLREDSRKARQENWELQQKITTLEKGSSIINGVDMDSIMATAELKVENRQLLAKTQSLEAAHKDYRTKIKALKKAKKSLEKQLGSSGAGATAGNGNVDDDSSSDSDSDLSSSGESSTSVDENTRVYFGDESEGTVGRDVH